MFYNKANGVQASLAFSKDFKHCNVVTFDGKDWIVLDFDRTGLLTRKINVSNADRLLTSLHVIREVTAVIAVSINARKKIRWKPFLIRSCNEICRYAAGIDIGLTFNPSHLHSKLLKYNNKKNYEIINAWRR